MIKVEREMAEGRLRITCAADIADEIRGLTSWFGSEPRSQSAYKVLTDGKPITYDDMQACDMSCSALPYLVRDVIVCRDEVEDPGYFISIIGRECRMTGTCLFHGRPCTFRVLTWKSGGKSHGVEIIFFNAEDRSVCMGVVFFYLDQGEDYDYNPYIVRTKNTEDLMTICLEIMCKQKEKAANKIKRAFMDAKFNPSYALCKKLLLHDMQNIL